MWRGLGAGALAEDACGDDPTFIRFTRPKRRRQVTERVRWRITLDQLLLEAKIDAKTFDAWADAGYLGSRLRERPNQGRGRHITRVTAQKTVLVARLVHAGISPMMAGHIASNHSLKDTTPLTIDTGHGVTVTIDRSDLP